MYISQPKSLRVGSDTVSGRVFGSNPISPLDGERASSKYFLFFPVRRHLNTARLCAFRGLLASYERYRQDRESSTFYCGTKASAAAVWLTGTTPAGTSGHIAVTAGNRRHPRLLRTSADRCTAAGGVC